MKLTEAQKRVLKRAGKYPQISAVGPELTTCRNLVEKGLLKREGYIAFSITEEGRKALESLSE